MESQEELIKELTEEFNALLWDLLAGEGEEGEEPPSVEEHDVVDVLARRGLKLVRDPDAK